MTVFPDAHFLSRHRELFHYTNQQGLEGIVSSDTLWATHYRDLNDTSEIVHLKSPLVEALNPKFKEEIAAHYSDHLGSQSEYHARRLAMEFVNALYRDTFDRGYSTASAEAFIASLCTHADDMLYEQENGLLSQWRCYSGGGGYCIVLDTALVEQSLQYEWDNRLWLFLQGDSVRYAHDFIRLEDLLPDLFSAATGALAGFVANKAVSREAIREFIAHASLLKHQGFKEECEVRIVAMPVTAPMLRQARQRRLRVDDKPLPTISTNPHTGRKHIALFQNSGMPLPIKRVIVGPSRDQDASYRFARSLLKSSVAVKRSATPWMPPI